MEIKYNEYLTSLNYLTNADDCIAELDWIRLHFRIHTSPNKGLNVLDRCILSARRIAALPRVVPALLLAIEHRLEDLLLCSEAPCRKDPALDLDRKLLLADHWLVDEAVELDLDFNTSAAANASQADCTNNLCISLSC